MEKRIDFAFRYHNPFSRVSVFAGTLLIAPDGPIVEDNVQLHVSRAC